MTEYIRREDVLEILHKVRYECVYNRQNVMYDGKVDAYKALVARFKETPAADVRPVVRGQWVQVMGKYDWMVKCSRCNGVPLETSNFCPNCGADMREEPADV